MPAWQRHRRQAPDHFRGSQGHRSKHYAVTPGRTTSHLREHTLICQQVTKKTPASSMTNYSKYCAHMLKVTDKLREQKTCT